MFVMMLYVEPQILYGMTRPTKIQRCQASSYQWKADTARQSLPTLLYGGFIKWHHTAVRDCQEKNSRSIERLFFYFCAECRLKKRYYCRRHAFACLLFLYRYFNLSTAQRIFALKTRWINNQATISQDYLFGFAPLAQADSKIFSFNRLRT